LLGFFQFGSGHRAGTVEHDGEVDWRGAFPVRVPGVEFDLNNRIARAGEEQVAFGFDGETDG